MDANNNQMESQTATTSTEAAEEIISMPKVEFERIVQGKEDKIRKEYARKNKELQNKIDELTPAQKSAAELDLEARLSELEAREKDLSLRAALQEANLDKSIADYVKADIDVGALCSVIDKIVNAKIAAQGYAPSGNHANNTGITLEQINRMDYTEVEKLYKANPDLIKKIIGK